MLKRRGARRQSPCSAPQVQVLLSEAFGRASRGRRSSRDSIESLFVRTWQHFPEVFKAVRAKGSACRNRYGSGVGAEEELAWQTCFH